MVKTLGRHSSLKSTLVQQKYKLLEEWDMRKILILALVLVIALVAVVPVLAHTAGPCNSPNEDGSFNGRDYAQHHIRPKATDGALGQDHKPGTHQGFSGCNPSGK